MSVDLNQTIAEGSLNNLHDIMLPADIGFFPLAPGWYILFLLAMTLLFHFGSQKYQSYKKDQYRRDALKEMGTYKEHTKANTLELLSLAKRVAICAYGREEIAKLYDNGWWDFVQTHSKVNLDDSCKAEISDLLYNKKSQSRQILFDEVNSFVSVWIETHKVEDHV